MNPFLLTKQKHAKLKKAPRSSGKRFSLAAFWKRIKTDRLLQGALALIFLAFLFILIYLYKQLPSPSNLTSSENFPVSTQIFDRNGKLLYEIYGNENRIPIKVNSLPKHVLEATIAIEDKNFYSHHGLDFRGLLRAGINNFSGGTTQGGSTITQQLVKNALLSNEKTFQRKIKEAVLAMMTEILYSKDEILEMYLNYISYGGTAVGIEAAANKYFDKSAKDLNLAEASLLAGLPQSPTTYSPFGSNPERSKNRQKEVLRRMVEDEYITNADAASAESEALNLAIKRDDIKAPHFVFYIKDLLYEKYGEKMVETGGLRVTTTLDLDLQETAQASLSSELTKLASLKVGNGAAIVTKPNTGEIIAMIGSKDYFDSAADGQVNVTLALRQPGSSIKPLMYATAFAEKTLNPGSMILDVPTCFKVAGQREYCPKNYTGGFSGPVSIRQSLGNSLNIPAVKALATIGVVKFMEQAKSMGINTWTDPANYGLSLTLGGGEVKMIELAEAFGVLANQGIRVPLNGILEISNYKGEVLEKYDSEITKSDLSYLSENELATEQGQLKRVMERAPAYMTSHILQDNNARQAAFGSNSELVIKNKIVSAKTGTTNDLRDNWTVGYTPEYLTIAWVGNNNSKSMSYLASGITGAAPIWHDIMQYILQDKETVWPEKPADVKTSNVCLTGMPAKSGLGEMMVSTGDNETSVGVVNSDTDPIASCESKGQEIYWESSKPSYSGTFRKEYWIRSETGLPPKEGEEAGDLKLEAHSFYYDPLTKLYCGDCVRAVDDKGKVIYEQNIINLNDVKNIL